MDKKTIPDKESDGKTVASLLFTILIFSIAGFFSICVAGFILIPSWGSFFGISAGLGLLLVLLIIISYLMKIKYYSHNMSSSMKTVLAIIIAVTAVMSAMFGSGVIGPTIINFIDPKYSILESTIYLQPMSIQGSTATIPSYPFCVYWKNGQEYKISISSNDVPIGVRILDEPSFLKFKNTNKLDFDLGSVSVYQYSTPYRPSKSGYFFILISNEGNMGAVVNLSIEASDTCAGYPLIGNEPIYQKNS